MIEIIVDGSKLQTIVQRQQHEGNNKVPNEITQHYLKVAKAVAANGSGYANKRNAAQRSANHTKRHKHPVAVAVADKKRFVIGIAAGVPGNAKQNQKVNKNERKQQKRRHKQNRNEQQI